MLIFLVARQYAPNNLLESDVWKILVLRLVGVVKIRIGDRFNS